MKSTKSLQKECMQTILEYMDLSCPRDILVCWKDEELIQYLLHFGTNLRLTCLMDSDIEQFISDRNLETMITYDYIIDNGLLEKMQWNRLLLTALGLHLKQPCGTVLSIYANIYHWSGWSWNDDLGWQCSYQNLYTVCSNLRIDGVQVGKKVYEVGFEQIQVVKKIKDRMPTEYVALKKELGDLVECALFISEFKSFQQLVAWLQSFFTRDIRRQLAFLLQRIDFDIETKRSVAEMCALCAAEDISSLYLNRMIDTVTIHKDRVKQLVNIVDA